METPGTLVDKLCTVDLKMWNNQESLYSIRRGTYEEFCARFNLPLDLGCTGGKSSSLELYNILKKACDLNVQRNALMNELDKKIIEMIKASKETDLSQYDLNPHKTY